MKDCVGFAVFFEKRRGFLIYIKACVQYIMYFGTFVTYFYVVKFNMQLNLAISSIEIALCGCAYVFWYL
jgi:hypothetical protein